MRIDHLEAQLRDLTGTVEQLQYRNHELEQEVSAPARRRAGHCAAAAPERAIFTASARAVLTAAWPAIFATTGPTARFAIAISPRRRGRSLPAAPAPAPVAPPEGEPTGSRRGDAFNPALDPTAPGAPRPLATSTAATEPPPPVPDAPGPAPRQPGAPLDLSSVSALGAAAPPSSGGDLPPPPPSNPNATGAMQAALPPSNSPKDEYDLAYGYVLHKDYGLAEQTVPRLPAQISE